MTEPPAVPPPMPPSESPTGPGERKPAWPIVIGVISIALAGLELLTNLLSVIGVGARRAQSPDISFPEWFKTYGRLDGLMGMVIASLLLVGGIALLRRRRSARPAHIVYAVLAIIASLIGAYALVSAMGDIKVPDPRMQEFMRAGKYIGAVFGVAIACAYPIFLLIWFDREKIRQQMQSWA